MQYAVRGAAKLNGWLAQHGPFILLIIFLLVLAIYIDR